MISGSVSGDLCLFGVLLLEESLGVWGGRLDPGVLGDPWDNLDKKDAVSAADLCAASDLEGVLVQ